MKRRFFGRAIFFFVVLFLTISCGKTSDDDGHSAPAGDTADTDDADDSADGGADDTGGFNPEDAFLHPEEPGPYLVGNTTFILEDSSRDLSCGPGKRRLVTEVWYPAADNAADWPENYFFDFFLDQLEECTVILNRHDVLPPDGTFEDYPTGSYRDAPLNPDAARMPILVFSHGFTSNRFQNYSMADYLASHGYVVVAPDHTCNSLVAPLPEGCRSFTYLDSVVTLFERVDDMSFLLDVFTEQTPEMFEGRLDVEHIGFWGHSFGGLTVSERVKTDRRVSALLQLASFGFPFLPDDLTVVSMYLAGMQDKVMYPFRAFHNRYIDLMPTPKYVLNFYDTGHFAFSDLCVYSWNLQQDGDGCGEGTRIGTGEPFTNPEHEAMLTVMNPYAVAFFGSVFFGYPELADYLAVDHFPEMMEYFPYFSD